MKFSINSKMSYLLVLLISSVTLTLILSDSSKGIGAIFFLLLTVPVFYYYAFLKLISLSKLLKNHNPKFYSKNLSTRRYKSLKLVNVSLFNFVNKIKGLENNDVTEIAVELKQYSNYSFISLVISFLQMLIIILI